MYLSGRQIGVLVYYVCTYIPKTLHTRQFILGTFDGTDIQIDTEWNMYVDVDLSPCFPLDTKVSKFYVSSMIMTVSFILFCFISS